MIFFFYSIDFYVTTTVLSVRNKRLLCSFRLKNEQNVCCKPFLLSSIPSIYYSTYVILNDDNKPMEQCINHEK